MSDVEKEKKRELKRKEQVSVHVVESEQPPIQSVVDVAVNEALTWKTALEIVLNPLTWLPALAYVTTFGFELALDAKMADVLYMLYSGKLTGFDQQTAGYYTSILYATSRVLLGSSTDKNISGFLNIVTRPFGGYVGDVVYRRWGTQGKKWWTLACGLIMGVSTIAGGFYLAGHKAPTLPERKFCPHPSLLHLHQFMSILAVSVVMGVFSVAAIFSELGNGANFALVPHCNAYNNVGVFHGLVPDSNWS